MRVAQAFEDTLLTFSFKACKTFLTSDEFLLHIITSPFTSKPSGFWKCRFRATFFAKLKQGMPRC